MNCFICPQCGVMNKKIIRVYGGRATIKFSVDEGCISTSEVLEDEIVNTYLYLCPECHTEFKEEEVVKLAKKLETPEGMAKLLKEG